MARKIILGFLIAIPIIGALIALDNHVIKNNDLLYELFYEYEIHYWILLGIAYIVFMKHQKKQRTLSRNFIFEAQKNPQLLLEMIGLQEDQNIKTKMKKIIKEISEIKKIYNINKQYGIIALMINKTEKHFILETEKKSGILKISNIKEITLQDIQESKTQKEKENIHNRKALKLFKPLVPLLFLGLFASIFANTINLNETIRLIIFITITIVAGTILIKNLYKTGMENINKKPDKKTTTQKTHQTIKSQFKENIENKKSPLSLVLIVLIIAGLGAYIIVNNYSVNEDLNYILNIAIFLGIISFLDLVLNLIITLAKIIAKKLLEHKNKK